MAKNSYKIYEYKIHCFRAYCKNSEEEILVFVKSLNEDDFLDVLLNIRKDWVIGSAISYTEFLDESEKYNSHINPTVFYYKNNQEGIETLKIQIQHVQTITINRRKYWTNRECLR